MDGYSLADIASVANEGNFGGNSAWIIILFVLIFGLGGNGFGRNTDQAVANNEILSGQKFDSLSRQINAIGDGLSSLGYAQTNQMSNEARAIQTQLSECCCTNQRNTDALRYDISQMFANANANTNAQTNKILEAINQNKIEALQGRINQLELQNAVAGVVRYPSQTTYTSGANPFCNCGCGYNNI